MAMLVLGLVLLLGVHSTRLIAPGLRDAGVARLGLLPWKILYAVLSLIGLVLIVQGYGEARMAPTLLWAPPVWTRHLAALLTLPAFVLMACAYVPGTRIRAKLGHPMVAGVKIWAFAHLIANGTLADLLLFGSFLVWSVVMFATLRRRDRAAGLRRPAGSASRDAIAIVAGVVGWAVFAGWLHLALIGVKPFG
ncbi:NnrU family protein [Methyloversatilis sp. XJ19-49]|uniref:NnrU family protein n=1 Tax=Methyloversatilis sp. XJ19-49 TaxID=2963429 RepID=UPI00211C00FF|nr:NnrU family protein [Methyloversatilis sp. XJ19-49]MCQ9377189.1 NnrU family protein [Methyloversatilis sp. XJ19-49]